MNPEPVAPYGAMDEADAEALRVGTIKKIVGVFSQCNSILDLPAEVVNAILTINRNDFWKLQNVIHLVSNSKLKFSNEDMARVLDDAKVARIMEEEVEPIYGPTGATGPMGHGITGPVGPTGPAGLAMNQLSKKQKLQLMSKGPIRAPKSPKR